MENPLKGETPKRKGNWKAEGGMQKLTMHKEERQSLKKITAPELNFEPTAKGGKIYGRSLCWGGEISGEHDHVVGVGDLRHRGGRKKKKKLETNAGVCTLQVGKSEKRVGRIRNLSNIEGLNLLGFR